MCASQSVSCYKEVGSKVSGGKSIGCSHFTVVASLLFDPVPGVKELLPRNVLAACTKTVRVSGGVVFRTLRELIESGQGSQTDGDSFARSSSKPRKAPEPTGTLGARNEVCARRFPQRM